MDNPIENLIDILEQEAAQYERMAAILQVEKAAAPCLTAG
jgi:hypothetical protein